LAFTGSLARSLRRDSLLRPTAGKHPPLFFSLQRHPSLSGKQVRPSPGAGRRPRVAGPCQARIPTEAGEPLPLSTREQDHVPVFICETIDALNAGRGGLFIDATVGLGGHARAILESSPDARIIGLDRDASSLAVAAERLAGFGDRAELIHSDYRELPELLARRGSPEVAGILADFGISSFQLGAPERGFSLQLDGPLDMRMDTSRGRTAAAIIEDAPVEELARIIFEYGEERKSRRIARAIVEARRREPVRRTLDLARIVAKASGPPDRGRRRIHPATRTFQAFRIAVNDELSNVDEFLLHAAEALQPAGRLAVITFHSLEDRIVKRQMRWLSTRCSCPKGASECACGQPNLLRLLTKRPLRPGDSEVRANPRSRSAKLRSAERV